MIQQFLTLEYGNKKKLREKLIGYYGDGNYEVVERSGNQWQIMVPRKLDLKLIWKGAGQGSGSLLAMEAITAHPSQPITVPRQVLLTTWCVHVPSFEKDVTRSYEDFVLESDTIMPWESSGQNIVTGGYGYVQKVKIHKDHHSFYIRQADI
ncbi:hypothetical protein IWW34DRAFT_836759 [Fusarium oxysporum f. sp. albedinis]|nr:hypothetical protein IWW34DRAFT_836759 [Fusarium oxysporum f. sp. albedinis]